MTIQEAKEFFAGSEFSDETKGKINAVLNGAQALGPNQILEIKALMQAELNRDFEETGADFSAVPEIAAADAEYAKKMGDMEREFAEDTAYAETELAALDEIRKKVAAVSDKLQADAIKQTI